MRSRTALEVWKLSLATIVVTVLLIDIHQMLRSVTTSADKMAESYVKQSTDVSNSANEMAQILLPEESRKEYRDLAGQAHKLLQKNMREALREADRGSRPPMDR